MRGCVNVREVARVDVCRLQIPSLLVTAYRRAVMDAHERAREHAEKLEAERRRVEDDLAPRARLLRDEARSHLISATLTYY